MGKQVQDFRSVAGVRPIVERQHEGVVGRQAVRLDGIGPVSYRRGFLCCCLPPDIVAEGILQQVDTVLVLHQCNPVENFVALLIADLRDVLQVLLGKQAAGIVGGLVEGALLERGRGSGQHRSQRKDNGQDSGQERVEQSAPAVAAGVEKHWRLDSMEGCEEVCHQGPCVETG